jgi:hypothetical protein
VTNIALVNLACVARRILADIHTGIETTVQRMKKETIVITIKKIEDLFIIDN